MGASAQQVVSGKKRIPVTKITVTRAEGPSSQCRKPVVVSDFAAADKIISLWSWTAPKEGGYDKCDFVIEFEDGETYAGCFRLKHSGNERLAAHVRSFCEWEAGLTVNPWCGEEKYRRLMDAADPAEKKSYEDFLNDYDIP